MTRMLRAIGALCAGLLLASLMALPAMAATVVTVNGVPISDVQIAARVKLLQLEGKGNTKDATDALVMEQLQLQEAKRLGIEVSDQQVSTAFQSVARNVGFSTDKLTQLLNARGVSMDTMNQRLRAAIAWNGVVQMAVKPKVNVSDLELDKAAAAKLKDDSSFDYILTEIVFVDPTGKAAASRTAAANQYRKSFKGCDSAVQLSLSYTDAAVRSIGRRHATQLPDAIAAELSKLNVGGITKPRVVDGGVSMLAVCSKESARDLTFIKSQLRQQSGTELSKAEADKYMANLKAKARIVYS